MLASLTSYFVNIPGLLNCKSWKPNHPLTNFFNLDKSRSGSSCPLNPWTCKLNFFTNKGNSSIPLFKKGHKSIERKQIRVTNWNRGKHINCQKKTEQHKHWSATKTNANVICIGTNHLKTTQLPYSWLGTGHFTIYTTGSMPQLVDVSFPRVSPAQ